METSGAAGTFAAVERQHLVQALRDVEPDAPTLCEGWTAHDLVAHLVARERRADSGPGIVLPALAFWTERVRRGYLHRPYQDLIRMFEGGPPLFSTFALPGVDAALNLTEHLVHCEDVRRAQPRWQARVLVGGLQDALWQMLAKRGQMLLRKVPARVELATPDGRTATVTSGPDMIRLTGEPAELVLYAFGRRAHARVELSGDPEALDRLRNADLRV